MIPLLQGRFFRCMMTAAVAWMLYQTAAVANASPRNEFPKAVHWLPDGFCVRGYDPSGYTYACLNDHGKPHCGCWPSKIFWWPRRQ
jgi:hypothetical protein